MQPIKVFLFGDVYVEQNGVELTFRDKTTRLIFAWLITQPHHSVSRAQLIEQFWPDVSDSKAHSNANTYLSYLRRTLHDYLNTTGTIVLVPLDPFWVDVEAFETLVSEADSLDKGSIKRLQTLEHAQELYCRGDFLSGHDELWCRDKRSRLKNSYLYLLQLSVNTLRERHKTRKALEAAREWSTLVPLAEHPQRELLLLHWKNNTLAEGLEYFEAFKQRIKQELESSPSAKLQNLAEELTRLQRARPTHNNAHKTRYYCKLLLAQADQYEYEGRRQEQETALIAKTLEQQAVLWWRTGQFAQATDASERSLAINEAIGNRQGRVANLTYLGYCQYYQGHYNEGLDYALKAHTLAQTTQEIELIARTHTALGMMYHGLGNGKQAVEHFEASLESRHVLFDNDAFFSDDLSNLGCAYVLIGDIGKAITRHKQALAISETQDMTFAIGRDHSNLASAYDDVGQYEQALIHYDKALESMEANKNVHGQVTTLLNLASTLETLDRVERSLERCEQALALARSIGDHEGEGGALLNQGCAYLKQKKLEQAENPFNAALALGEDLDNKELEASLHSSRAQLFLERGELQKALAASQKAIDLLANIDVLGEEAFWLTYSRACEANGLQQKAVVLNG